MPTGWTRETLAADSPLAALVMRRSFLTKFEGYLSPDQMQDDWFFPLDRRGQSFHKVQIEYDYTNPQPFFCAVVLLLALLGGAGVWTHGIVRRRHVRRLIGVGKQVRHS